MLHPLLLDKHDKGSRGLPTPLSPPCRRPPFPSEIPCCCGDSNADSLLLLILHPCLMLGIDFPQGPPHGAVALEAWQPQQQCFSLSWLPLAQLMSTYCTTIDLGRCEYSSTPPTGNLSCRFRLMLVGCALVKGACRCEARGGWGGVPDPKAICHTLSPLRTPSTVSMSA